MTRWPPGEGPSFVGRKDARRSGAREDMIIMPGGVIPSGEPRYGTLEHTPFRLSGTPGTGVARCFKRLGWSQRAVDAESLRQGHRARLSYGLRPRHPGG